MPMVLVKQILILLLTIPLLILAGSVMDKGGIGKKLIDTVERFVGKIKGGLGVVVQLFLVLYLGAISGSFSATLSV